MGYRRPGGPPGARNHLVVVSAMDNANPLARRIGKLVREAVVVNTPSAATSSARTSGSTTG